MTRYYLVSAALDWASNRQDQSAINKFNEDLDKTNLDYDGKVHMLIALLYHKSDNQITFAEAVKQISLENL